MKAIAKSEFDKLAEKVPRQIAWLGTPDGWSRCIVTDEDTYYVERERKSVLEGDE